MTRSQIKLWHMAAIIFIVGICDAIIGINLKEYAFLAAGIFNLVFSALAVAASYRTKPSTGRILAGFNIMLVAAGFIFSAANGIISVAVLGTAEIILAIREYKMLRAGR